MKLWWTLSVLRIDERGIGYTSGLWHDQTWTERLTLADTEIRKIRPTIRRPLQLQKPSQMEASER